MATAMFGKLLKFIASLLLIAVIWISFVIIWGLGIRPQSVLAVGALVGALAIGFLSLWGIVRIWRRAKNRRIGGPNQITDVPPGRALDRSGYLRCPRCGTENSQNAKFCNGCGNPLTPATPAEPVEDGSVLRGKVGGFQERQVQGEGTTWTFRVGRYDSLGNRLAPVPVEMRSVMGFQGFLSEGDDVEIREKRVPGKALSPKEVTNLTTNIVVRAKRFPWNKVLLVIVIMAIGMLTVIYVNER